MAPDSGETTAHSHWLLCRLKSLLLASFRPLPAQLPIRVLSYVCSKSLWHMLSCPSNCSAAPQTAQHHHSAFGILGGLALSFHLPHGWVPGYLVWHYPPNPRRLRNNVPIVYASFSFVYSPRVDPIIPYFRMCGQEL